MTLNNDIMKDIFTFENDDEKLQFEAEIIHLDIMNEIKILMDAKNIKKADLAKKLKTSKGYITQLFSGDKLINLKTIAKIQQIFDVKLTNRFIEKSNFIFPKSIEFSKHNNIFQISNAQELLEYDDSDDFIETKINKIAKNEMWQEVM